MHKLKSIPCHSLPGKQRGVVLIVALIMMLAMTIISMSSMTSSTLEERMSSNMKDRQLAFQAAEAALRYGESIATNYPEADFATDCTAGLCYASLQGIGVPYPHYWNTWTTDPQFAPGFDVWADGGGTYIEYTNAAYAPPNSATSPRIIIEFMGQQIQDFANGVQADDPRIYRITALGFGKSRYSRVMLQSSYIEP